MLSVCSGLRLDYKVSKEGPAAHEPSVTPQYLPEYPFFTDISGHFYPENTLIKHFCLLSLSCHNKCFHFKTIKAHHRIFLSHTFTPTHIPVLYFKQASVKFGKEDIAIELCHDVCQVN